MKKRLHLLLLLFVSSSFAFSLTATDQPDLQLRKEAHKKTRAEVRAYVNKHVMPVLKEYRRQFDKQLSATDKRKVAQLRQELKKLNQEQQQFRNAGRTLTEEQRARLQAQHAARRQVYDAAATIARNYQPQLERIYNSLNTHKTNWEKDLKAIANAPVPDNDKGHRRPPHFGKRMPYQHLLRPAHFILWDTKDLPAPDETATASNLTVYPNPSTSTTTIHYTLAQAGPVKITLLNGSGNSVRVITNEQKQPGTHTQEVNVQQLSNGIYFYKIETAAGSQTLRFLKK